MVFTKVKGGTLLHVRTRYLYLGSGWMDCAEIWFIVRDPLAWRYTKGNGVTRARVHVRTPFPYLGATERIALKLVVWSGDH